MWHIEAIHKLCVKPICLTFQIAESISVDKEAENTGDPAKIIADKSDDKLGESLQVTDSQTGRPSRRSRV